MVEILGADQTKGRPAVRRAEAAMTAIRLEGGVKRVCLADQARGCEDDARDECSEAAIQQDFVKDLGHDRLHSCTPWPKGDGKVLGSG
jgi:hypothetical protein